MPSLPARFLTPEQLADRRAADRERRWRRQGVPKLRDPSTPLAPSTLRTRAYRARLKESRQSRVQSGLSPKPTSMDALARSLTDGQRAELLAILSPAPMPRPKPDLAPEPDSPQLRRVREILKAVLSGQPFTQTPEFLLALTSLLHSEPAPEPRMPSVVTFD